MNIFIKASNITWAPYHGEIVSKSISITTEYWVQSTQGSPYLQPYGKSKLCLFYFFRVKLDK